MITEYDFLAQIFEMKHFFQRLAQSMNKKDVPNQTKEYLCKLMVGWHPQGISRKKYEEFLTNNLQRKFPDLSAENIKQKVEVELKKKACQDIRPYISKFIKPHIINLIKEDAPELMLMVEEEPQFNWIIILDLFMIFKYTKSQCKVLEIDYYGDFKEENLKELISKINELSGNVFLKYK